MKRWEKIKKKIFLQRKELARKTIVCFQPNEERRNVGKLQQSNQWKALLPNH